MTAELDDQPSNGCAKAIDLDKNIPAALIQGTV